MPARSPLKAVSRRRPPLILVTGAGSGIGAALAREFARVRPEVRLALVGRRLERLQAVAADCEALGAEARFFGCDVEDQAAVEALAGDVSKTWRRGPDVVVNNAGRFAPARLAETTPALFDEMLSANLRAPFLVTRTFLPAMLKRGAGDLVFIGSVAGRVGLPGCAAYAAAKHGLAGLAAALRAETRGTGVRVLAVHPGATATPAWDGVEVPSARLMRPESVAAAVVALVGLGEDAVAEELILRPAEGDL